MKTSNTNITDLTTEALDWAMATYLKLPIKLDPMGFKVGSQARFWIWDDAFDGKMLLIGGNYSPSTNWLEGGKIIDTEGISFNASLKLNGEGFNWSAITTCGITSEGETALIASIKAYLISKLGKTIAVPVILL